MLNILVVDDYRDFRAIAGMGLTAAGYSVHTAGDGYEAVRALSSSWFDLAVIDLRLPGLNGLELIAWVRAWRDLPCLLVTGSDDGDLIRAALEYPQVEVLFKPVTALDIQDHVERMARAKAA